MNLVIPDHWLPIGKEQFNIMVASDLSFQRSSYGNGVLYLAKDGARVGFKPHTGEACYINPEETYRCSRTL